jgi:hypothetical protein
MRPGCCVANKDWGNEVVISEVERRAQAYLFKLRPTRRVRRALERAMRDADWRDAGAGWQANMVRSACWAGAGNGAWSCSAAVWPR